jgi:hypothetical protein
MILSPFLKNQNTLADSDPFFRDIQPIEIHFFCPFNPRVAPATGCRCCEATGGLHCSGVIGTPTNLPNK